MNDQINPKIIDQIIQEEMSEMNIPGLSITIVKDTKPIYIKGFGRADSRGNKVTEKTLFYLGSSSKSFTAMAIMQLSDKGLLNVDESVEKYLPWFKLADCEASKQINIRHLLDHTSGFSTYSGMKAFNRSADESLDNLIKNLHNIKLNRPVGASFEYSNLNYIILGEIIQAISGSLYEDYIDKNIFTQLGMKHSFATKAKADEYGVASGHQPILGIVRQTEHQFHQAIVPAGYLVSCAEDMSNYLIANLNGGRYKNTQVLSENGLSQMHQKSSKASLLYGFGWFNYENLVHHGGSCENYHTNMTLIPSEKLGIVIQYNINDNLSGAFVKGNYSAGETTPYDRIQSRILNYLMEKDIISPVIGNGKGVYRTVNTILLVMYAALAAYGIWYCTASQLYLPLLLIINLALPILMLVGIPQMFKGTWKALFRFAAGFAQVLYAIPLFLVIIGVLKIVVFYINK